LIRVRPRPELARSDEPVSAGAKERRGSPEVETICKQAMMVAATGKLGED